MRITVTQEHIDKGLPGMTDECPIALAVKALGYDRVCVDDESVEASRGEGRLFYGYLSDEATQFVHDFDGEIDVEPFTFEALGDEERSG